MNIRSWLQVGLTLMGVYLLTQFLTLFPNFVQALLQGNGSTGIRVVAPYLISFGVALVLTFKAGSLAEFLSRSHPSSGSPNELRPRSLKSMRDRQLEDWIGTCDEMARFLMSPSRRLGWKQESAAACEEFERRSGSAE